MAEIQLSDGNIWYILDYKGEEYDKTVASQSAAQFELSSSYMRKKDCTDLDFSYMGSHGEYALSGALPAGTAISRDHIDADIRSGFLFSSREEKVLNQVYPSDFKQVFRKKYREKYGNANIAFVDSETDSDIFPREKQPTGPIFDSTTDLLLVVHEDNIDDSFNVLKDIRKEAENDLQRLADNFLGGGE